MYIIHIIIIADSYTSEIILKQLSSLTPYVN